MSLSFVVIAGDISPIDVISHIPVACEDNKVPYAYVPSRFVSNVTFLSPRLFFISCYICSLIV